ncbi:MAG: hypothetical protein AAF715_28000 [Myxococcota bacterium]
MPLLVQALQQSLASQWLGENHPDSATESGDRFAGAVSAWFAGAMAATFPCVTALARRSQLAAAAGAAFEARDPNLAGQQLALAVASYIAGQSFPPGAALFPTALQSATQQMVAVFSDPGDGVEAKARDIAAACYALCTSTQVVIPVPPGPPTAPIL